jgi:hypothetical protein
VASGQQPYVHDLVICLAAPTVLLSEAEGAAGAAEFVALVHGLGDAGSDPTVRLVRERRVRPGRIDERLRLVSHAAGPISTELSLTIAADLTPINAVRTSPVVIDADDDGQVTLRWEVEGGPRDEVAVSWSVQVEGRDGSARGSRGVPPPTARAVRR